MINDAYNEYLNCIGTPKIIVCKIDVKCRFLFHHGRWASASVGEATVNALAVHHHLLCILLDTYAQRGTATMWVFGIFAMERGRNDPNANYFATRW
jgi:hypothetical protein